MPNGWEGNRRSGVRWLGNVTDLSSLSTYGLEEVCQVAVPAGRQTTAVFDGVDQNAAPAAKSAKYDCPVCCCRYVTADVSAPSAAAVVRASCPTTWCVEPARPFTISSASSAASATNSCPPANSCTSSTTLSSSARTTSSPPNCTRPQVGYAARQPREPPNHVWPGGVLIRTFELRQYGRAGSNPGRDAVR